LFCGERHIILLIGAILTSAFITIDPIQAETGKGEDVFKVIMTIFGVDKSKGDIVAIVSVNNSEASRVKFLDAKAPYVVPITNPNTPGGKGGLIEYIATFPNVTVSAGDDYKACVPPLRHLDAGSLVQILQPSC
jgi:hypothetical protein